MKLTVQDWEKVTKIIEHYEPQIDKDFEIPLSEYEERYARVWKVLEERNIDLGFFFWYREMPGDGIYMTGYNPNIERASAVIAPGKRPMLLCGPESGILSKEVGLNLRTEFVNEFSIPDEYYEGLERANLQKVIAEYAGEIKKIGYMTFDDQIPAQFMNFLHTSFGDVEVVDATDILQEMRYEKSESEFKCMKAADTIACAAVRAMLAVTKPGIGENEVAAVGDFTAMALGACGFGFETIVNSGDRCRTVIGPATNKIIQEGELVQVGISPSFKGYKGINRRGFVCGERNELQKQYFEVMNKGYEVAAAALKETCEKDLPSNYADVTPRTWFENYTLEGVNVRSLHFYSTCHGTGLTECNEKMVITPTNETPYGKNVGMMLDLGLYGHPNTDICGACVEDAYFKKGNELIKLSDMPIDVQDLVGKGL